MHGAVVMLLALSGLGCQNRIVEAGNPPAPSTNIASPEANPFPSSATPPPYPSYYPVAHPETADMGEGGLLRRTFCSFFLGRDPEVRTPREVQASAFGNGNGQ